MFKNLTDSTRITRFLIYIYKEREREIGFGGCGEEESHAVDEGEQQEPAGKMI